MLLYKLVQKKYFATWQNSLAGSISQRTSHGSMKPKSFLTFNPASSQENALLRKDILTFIRDPGQWAQLFLLLALLAIYFFNIRYVPKDIEIEKWRTIIAIMNLGFSGFVLATLAVRFIYPSISLEGKSFWVIISAPISLKTIFWQKYLFAFITFLIITEPIALLSGLILHMDLFHYIITAGGILVMSISLSCLAVGFGAAYPYFLDQNPSQIASSPGGVLTIGISLGYLGLMLGLIAIPAYKYTGYLVSGGSFPIAAVGVSTALIFILNVLMIAIPIGIGYRSLMRREF
jgi:ABC-2 type transport system permease protein